MLELLDVGGSDVRMVGIWGIGGIGKTTIAKAVYNIIAHKFEGYCFLGDVRVESAPHQGLVRLQNILLSELLGEKKMKITNVDRGINVIKERLGNKRVLLVLDDVSELDQLDKLAGDSNWFGHRSKIIITTRDKHLLVAHQVYQIYKARKLDNDEACELLSLNAFKDNRNPDEFPISTAVMYTHGHPLAINILGSLLCGKSIDQWQAALDSYKRFPDSHVQKILETSYIALEYPLREAFLDIACLLNGRDEYYVMQALEGSGLINPLHAIEQLEEKALLNIDECGFLRMHDLLEEIGKEIVRRESPTDACSRSRLWFHEDVYQVLTENTGTSKVKGIRVELPTEDEICLGAKCFKKMVNLQIFININARFSGEIRYLPNQLRFLDWRHYPLESFPSDFNPQKLVLLNIRNSNISRLVQGFKIFKNLKEIRFDGCEFLTEFPVLPGMFPNVESLSFANCSNLVEVPRIVHMKSLKYLDIFVCKRLESFPEIGGRMESLRQMTINNTAIKQIPASIGYELINLEILVLDGCENLTTLPRSIYGLQHLEGLHVFECPKMTLLEENIPTLKTSKEISLDKYYDASSETERNDDEGNLPLPCVLYISLEDSAIVSLPVFFSKFGQVISLNLHGCTKLKEISELLPNLKYLDVSGCVSLERIVKLSNILKREESQMLEILHLSGCQMLWANLVNEADEQGWLVNGQVEADDMSLFLLSQQSAFVVIFPGIKVPNWFGCEMAYQGSQVFEFHIEILPNFDWENTGLAACFVTREGKSREIDGHCLLKIYINELLVQLRNGDKKFCPSRNISSDVVCLCYIPFKVLDMSQFGQIRPIPPFHCRLRIELAFWSEPVKSCGVHLVMPPKEDVCMKLSHRPSVNSTNPHDDTEFNSINDSHLPN